MIIYKTKEEIAILREAGVITSEIMEAIVEAVKPGAKTGDIDEMAERLMLEAGGRPAFKGYGEPGDKVVFPTTLCASINHEVVHAPAIPSRELKAGDIFKVDMGMWLNGMCTDMAATIPVGEVDAESRKLMNVTKEALMIGVGKVRDGGWVSDVGKAVDKYVRRNGFSTVKDLVGHGVGRYVHEDPRIPNYFDPQLRPVRFKQGMTVAIEPMINIGTDQVRLLYDGWTIITADKQRSAHYEVTVAITEKGTEIMTPLPRNLLI